MPVFSPKASPCPSYKVRSISFPSRSHPTLVKIQQSLNKLTSNPLTDSSSRTLLLGLSGLGDIYKSVQNLLQLPLTQQSISREDKCIAEALDDLIRFLDLCSNMRECILSMKQSVRQIQSSLRRSKAAGGGGGGGDQLSFESDISAYFSTRKKMKKEAIKFMSCLKIKQTQFGDNNTTLNVIKALREANWVVFNSLVMFLSAPVSKTKYWPPLMFSKLVGKKSVVCESQEEKKMNEMHKVDFALNNLLTEMEYSSPEKMESAQKMMESLDMSLEEFEVELECLFRHMIHTRVTLLNLVSHSN